MTADPTGSPYDEFLAAADRAAAERPDVDLDLARELMLEAATMLDNGLAFDGLDEHDTRAAIEGVAAALVDPDPAEAIRTRSDDALGDPGDLHEPESVSRSFLVAASILRI
jgi:hypothetical protein